MSDTQHQVNVRVDTRYLPEQSAPEQNRFAFAYTVTIENQGEVPAQLLSRHWIITDGDGRTQEVRGAGVVGEQPLIAPGAQHTYTSGTVLATGSQHARQLPDARQRRNRLRRAIPVFRLAVPGALH